MKRRYFLAALLAAVSVPGLVSVFGKTGLSAKPGRYTDMMDTKDGKRQFIVRVPSGYDGKKPFPLVVFMHGRGGNGMIAERGYNWVELAEKENFIVCFPTAKGDRNGIPTWNAGYNAGRGGADDVAFLSSLIGKLKSTYAIDSKRVYMAGHSSGAMMSYRYGAEKADQIAAIGPVSGSVGNDGRLMQAHAVKPVAPISVIAFHGKKDPIVPYDYHQEITGSALGKFVPAPESVRWFADADGCTKTPKREESFGGNIVKETFPGGNNGTEVVLYTIVDGQHAYPGGKSYRKESGAANQQINATELMWTFFKAHPKQRPSVGATDTLP